VAPGGRLVAVLSAEWTGRVDRHKVQVIDLAGSTVVYEAILPELGRSPALAVDDNGAVTVVSGYDPAELAVLEVDASSVTATMCSLKQPSP
jgi:hypothetical protein